MDARDFLEIVREDKNSELFVLGTVDRDYKEGRPKIQFDGEDTLSEKSYPCISSYTPKPNDRVLMVKLKGTIVVLGSIK